MAKGQILQDTFEQLAELGKSTVKASAKAVGQTFNPAKMAEDIIAPKSGDQGVEELEKGKSQKNNHTPLDFDKLKGNYGKQDEQNVKAMRQRLFNLVKQGESKAIDEGKKEEQERQQKELHEQQEKKRRHEEQKKQEEASAAPQGKVKRTIGAAHKKKAQEAHMEVKANKSKD